MKYSIGFDLSGSLAGITCPVMALNGTKDSQVQCERNLDVLKSSLPSCGKNLIKAEEGLNHLFQHCTTGAFSEYKEIEETISPEVLSEMITWIKSL